MDTTSLEAVLAKFEKKYGKVTVADMWEAEQRKQQAEQRERIELARADARAVWTLADYLMPADVKETAERWKVNETLQEIWRQAFIAGWRAAHKAKDQS